MFRTTFVVLTALFMLISGILHTVAAYNGELDAEGAGVGGPFSFFGAISFILGGVSAVWAIKGMPKSLVKALTEEAATNN